MSHGSSAEVRAGRWGPGGKESLGAPVPSLTSEALFFSVGWGCCPGLGGEGGGRDTGASRQEFLALNLSLWGCVLKGA